ncbi:MAG: hypothetical protein R6W89_12085 [Candidatus Hydrogenedentota bacterium]
MKFTTTIAVAITSAFFAALPVQASEIRISSLEELAEYASQDGNTVTMEPGEYPLIDYIPLESIPERREEEDWHFLEFSGSGNVFDLTDVTIEVDTELRNELDPPIHNPEFVVSGSDNTLKGLTITNIGDGTSRGGNVLSVHGDDNTLRGVTLRVRGSFPYGYGDLLGKGGGSLVGLRKHSGLQITGNNTRVIGCEIYMRSFGHGFYIQDGATNTYFEDCYVEGEMRSTDDMLAETSGPAHEVDFASVARNREGENKILPGYKKCLAEDGFRTYSGVEDVTFINCAAKHMRAGFELRHSGPIRIEDSKTIGHERGFWVGTDAVIEASRGDAKYGPLLFLEGEGSSVELELMPEDSEMNVHALATIHGSDHEVSIGPWEGKEREEATPIKLGFSQPGGGQGMAPIGERAAHNIALTNATSMPIIIGEQASGCEVVTQGEVLENAGEDIAIESGAP